VRREKRGGLGEAEGGRRKERQLCALDELSLYLRTKDWEFAVWGGVRPHENGC